MMLSSILFLVAAALLPPLVLLRVVYQMDKLDREPGALLLALFFRGALAMVPILVLEVVADQFIDFFPWRPIVYLFLAYFVVPGCIEEGVKYRVLLRRTWNEPHFNHRFDGVVYGVFVSLGFAAVENVLYVLTSGFSTAVVRAIFSIPGHAMFGVVMGEAMSRAKWLEVHGQREQAGAAGGGPGFCRRFSTVCMTFCSWDLAGFFMDISRGWWSMWSVCCGKVPGRTGQSTCEAACLRQDPSPAAGRRQ